MAKKYISEPVLSHIYFCKGVESVLLPEYFLFTYTKHIKKYLFYYFAFLCSVFYISIVCVLLLKNRMWILLTPLALAERLTTLFEVTANFNSPDLEAGRIHALHARVVEVVAKGQNKVSSHLLRYFTHLPCCGLLHSCDVGWVGQASPVPYGQELEGSPVFW